ncbi:hypothetical protein DEIPH_ctg005orf0038 [Deinococcus phoenicis]|uniref:Bacterial sugar transferase domain-containing protein n=1 Tax=Deinococcus phoenicis TaxID=1476583 RepID=A0A016QTU0_9DEIO|nr:sugar transferase [Deinococcus phoenicis]EYB69478.1 hypothetical protein DEIPH_ctg005orf0038 [Deinococcus phoenicis]
MNSSSLSPRRSWRPQLRHLLRLADTAGLLLMGLLFWSGQGVLGLDGQGRGLLLRLWLVAGLLGWLLGRREGERSPLFPERPVLFTPVWSFLISGALFLAVGRFDALPLLLPLHLLWLGLNVFLHRVVRRVSPRLRVGISATTPLMPRDAPGNRLDLTSSAVFAHPGIEYLRLNPQDPAALAQVDLLLSEPERSVSTEYRRLLAHAHVTKVPVWPKTLADEEITGKVALHLVDRQWLNAETFRSRYAPLKRVLDVTATLLALPVLLPVMAVVALVVWFNSGRPVLFWQERVGQNGQTFRIVKFRTMSADSERRGPAFARRGDQRVTPVGSFLRKFRLDELPQFWNVLRGEMSIIGPRPEQWAFAADFEESIPLYACRHWVRPGITGWAQVNQGYTDSLDQTTEKLQYDFYYVKHLSLSLDLVIVGKTLRTILTGFGSR